MQHMQLGNQQKHAFTINLSTKKLTETMAELLFQKTLIDDQINNKAEIQPYFPNPYPFWTN